MDYKELIELLRRTVEHGNEEPWEYCTNRCGGCEMCDQAADALETLLAERDAAIDDIQRNCINCAYTESNNSNHTPCEFIEFCSFAEHWKWRGPQKQD